MAVPRGSVGGRARVRVGGRHAVTLRGAGSDGARRRRGRRRMAGPLAPSARVGGSRALTALAFGTAVPESLRSAPSATALRAFSDLGLGAAAERLTQQLGPLYAGDIMLADAARDALDALTRLPSLHDPTYQPANAAVYGNDDL